MTNVYPRTMAKYDPSHDAYHVQRVRKTALALARDVSADPLTFFTPFFESVRGHVDLFKNDRAVLIAKIVNNVSWSTEKKLRAEGAITTWHESCVELHCVQDADRLDAIGAFGIMRCAAFSCTANRPLYVPSQDPAFEQSAVGHFHDKLLKIKERLKTEMGKKLGEERHKYMISFLNALESEYNWLEGQ
ncbi:metal dependent phosphohydrolase [Pyrrhoderma noxium]|uniref:Metal dependent phosphohydrolase n=1 Tax=Pyrrhoderma noxium TaxID=2282107 RepID=A0A286U9J6_9AGAM|nr:metal dependent phosphohydrolase [Pyrrhoderma noxium]